MSDVLKSSAADRRKRNRAARPKAARTESAEGGRPRLTKRQHDVLRIIEDSLEQNGYPPTVREICAKIGANSPNAAAFHLRELERKGYLARGAKQGRALTIVQPSKEFERTIPFRGKVS